MDVEVREKLRKGVQYNMRIVIRGEVNTGKTALWNRLQGQKFNPAYRPSESIQIAHIPWSYKVTDDNVKVEVWDVVDKARAPEKKKTSTDASLKLSTSEMQFFDEKKQQKAEKKEKAKPIPVARDFSSAQSGSFTVQLDATQVDVMKGTNAVIFTMDQRREWTFSYVQKEVPKIPKNVYVLILGSYRDKGTEGLKVSSNEIMHFCRAQGGHVHFLECSMVDCFGLVGVKTFLYLPFLQMQKTHLEAVLRQNEAEHHSVFREFELVVQHNDYEQWQNKIKNREAMVSTVPSKATVLSTSSDSSGVVDLSKQVTQTQDQVQLQRQKERQEAREQRAAKRERERQEALSSSGQEIQETPSLPASPKKTEEREEERAKRELEARLRQEVQQGVAVREAKGEPKEESFFATFSSLVGAEKKNKNDAVVDDLRKLSEKRKMEQERAKMSGAKIEATESVNADDFVPDAEDDGFWSDDGGDEKHEEKKSSSSSESSDNNSLLLQEDEGDEEVTYTATIVKKVTTPTKVQEPKQTIIKEKEEEKEEEKKSPVTQKEEFKIPETKDKPTEDMSWLEEEGKEDKGWLDNEDEEEEEKEEDNKRQHMMSEDEEEEEEEDNKRNPMMMDDEEDPDEEDFSYTAPVKSLASSSSTAKSAVASKPSVTSPTRSTSSTASTKSTASTQSTVSTQSSVSAQSSVSVQSKPSDTDSLASVVSRESLDDDVFDRLYRDAYRIDPYDASTSIHQMQPIAPNSIYANIEEPVRRVTTPTTQAAPVAAAANPFFGSSSTQPSKTKSELKKDYAYLYGDNITDDTDDEDEEEDPYNYNYSYSQAAPTRGARGGVRGTRGGAVAVAGARGGRGGRGGKASAKDDDWDIEELGRAKANDPWSLDGEGDDDILTVKTYPAPQTMGVALGTTANSLTSGAHQLRTVEMRKDGEGPAGPAARGGRGGRGARGVRGARARGARGAARGGRGRGGAMVDGGE
eukprot:TRINITY_DN3676_c0_g1_i3.p1 TRINITY_DN3676_c0_g1~~TRINITY_DN3676_c0_g1_i3.p1  ORF type:complete len:1003 (+),score=286.83 TRINITY_DN3676_c0_g1_i3:91-3009(+)